MTRSPFSPFAFLTVKSRGPYEAFLDRGGQCLLRFDGRKWWTWVQGMDAVRVAAVTKSVPGALVLLQEGEYLLAERPGDPGQVAPRPALLFLELPMGYQEYEMPEGWPLDETPRLLRITDRIWSPERLKSALSALSGAAGQGAATAGREDAVATSSA